MLITAAIANWRDFHTGEVSLHNYERCSYHKDFHTREVSIFQKWPIVREVSILIEGYN